jgi:acyl carrier protein
MIEPALADYLARRQSALDRVRHMLVQQLGLPWTPAEIDPDTPLFEDGLGLDSVDAIEIIVSMEEEFGVVLPDDALGRARLRTVNLLVDRVLEVESRG